MNTRNLLAAIALAFVLAGCAAAPRHASVDDRHNALLAGSSWETNRAVMEAGERTGNLQIALSAGESELKDRPDNDEARVMLSRIETRVGRPEQAFYNLSQLSPRHRETPQAELEYARACIATSRFKEAQESLEKVSSREPDIVWEKKRLSAVTEDLSGEHALAQQHYRDLLAEREDEAVRYNLGRSYISTRDYRLAAAALLPLTENPRYPMARVLAAGSFAKIGDKTAAKNLLEGYLSDYEIESLLSGRKGVK